MVTLGIGFQHMNLGGPTSVSRTSVTAPSSALTLSPMTTFPRLPCPLTAIFVGPMRGPEGNWWEGVGGGRPRGASPLFVRSSWHSVLLLGYLGSNFLSGPANLPAPQDVKPLQSASPGGERGFKFGPFSFLLYVLCLLSDMQWPGNRPCLPSCSPSEETQ